MLRLPSPPKGKPIQLTPDPAELPKVLRVIPLNPYQPIKDTPKGLLIHRVA